MDFLSKAFITTKPDLLSSSYSLVIFGNLLIAIQLLVIIYIVIKKRVDIFKGRFMKQFEEEHKKAFSLPAAKLGYPDTGNGRYSKKLSYKEWYIFNCAQRIHHNYLEGFALVVVTSLASGILYPSLTFSLQVAYLIGRSLYSVGYLKGADYRIAGAGINMLSQLVLLVLSVKSALSIV